MNKKEMDFVMKALGGESLLPLEIAAKSKLITYYAIRTAFLYGRSPTKEDSGATGAYAIIIGYVNRGTNRRVEYAGVDQIDIESVSEKSIMFYSKSSGCAFRASLTIPQIFLVSEDDAKAVEFYKESVRHL